MPVDLNTFNYGGYLEAIGVSGFDPNQLNDAQKQILYNDAAQRAYKLYTKQLRQEDPFSSGTEIKKEAIRQSLDLFPSGRSAFSLPEERTTEDAFSMDEFKEFLMNRPVQSEDLTRDFKEFAKTRIHNTTEWQYPELKDVSKEEFVQLFMEHNGIDEFSTRSDILNDNVQSSQFNVPEGRGKTGVIPSLVQGFYNAASNIGGLMAATEEVFSGEKETNWLLDWAEEKAREYKYVPTHQETWTEAFDSGRGLIPFYNSFYGKLLEGALENWSSVLLNAIGVALAVPTGGSSAAATATATGLVSNASKAVKLVNILRKVANKRVLGGGLMLAGSGQELGAMRVELEKEGFYNPENDLARLWVFGGMASALDGIGAYAGLGGLLKRQAAPLMDAIRGRGYANAARLTSARASVTEAAEALASVSAGRGFGAFVRRTARGPVGTALIEGGTETVQENLALDVGLYRGDDLPSSFSALGRSFADYLTPGSNVDYPDRLQEGERFERGLGAFFIGAALGGTSHFATSRIHNFVQERAVRKAQEKAESNRRTTLQESYTDTPDDIGAVDPDTPLTPYVSTSIPSMEIYSTPDDNVLVGYYAGRVVEVKYDEKEHGTNLLPAQKRERMMRSLVNEITQKHNEKTAKVTNDDINTSGNSSEISFIGRDNKRKRVVIEGDTNGTIAGELVKQHNDKSNILTLNESMDITRENLGVDVTLDSARDFIIGTNNTYRGRRTDIDTIQSGYLDIPLNVEGEATPTFKPDEGTEEGSPPTYNNIIEKATQSGFTVVGDVTSDRMTLVKDGLIYEVSIRSKGSRSRGNFGSSSFVKITDALTGEELKPKRRDIRENASRATSSDGAGDVISPVIRVSPPMRGIGIIRVEGEGPLGTQISDEDFRAFVAEIGAEDVSRSEEGGDNTQFIRRVKFGKDQNNRVVSFLILKDSAGRLTLLAHNGNRAVTEFETIDDFGALGDNIVSGSIIERARQRDTTAGFRRRTGAPQLDNTKVYNVYEYTPVQGRSRDEEVIVYHFSGRVNGNPVNTYYTVKYVTRNGRKTLKWSKVGTGEMPFWQRIVAVQEATSIEEMKQHYFREQLLETNIYQMPSSNGDRPQYLSHINGDVAVPTFNPELAFYSNQQPMGGPFTPQRVYMLRHPKRTDALLVMDYEQVNNDPTEFLAQLKKHATAISPDSDIKIPDYSHTRTSTFNYIEKYINRDNSAGDGNLDQEAQNLSKSMTNNVVQDDSQIDMVTQRYPNEESRDNLINDIEELRKAIGNVEKVSKQFLRDADDRANRIASTFFENRKGKLRDKTFEELKDIYRRMLTSYYLKSINVLYNTPADFLSSDQRQGMSNEVVGLLNEIENLQTNEPQNYNYDSYLRRLRSLTNQMESTISTELEASSFWGRTLAKIFTDGGLNYNTVAGRIRKAAIRNTHFSLQHPFEPTGTERIPRHNKASLFTELARDNRVSNRVLGDLISSEAVRILNNQREAIDILKSLKSQNVDTETFMPEGLISGFVASDGRIYLVADGIFEGKATGVFMHELGVHFKRMGMSDSRFQQILSELSRRVGEIQSQNLLTSERSAEENALLYAYKLAKDGGLNEENEGFWEEVAAYLVQENVDLAGGFLGRLNSEFKAAANRIGLVDISTLSNKDLVNFAIGASRNLSRFDFNIRYEDNGINNDLIHFLTGNVPVYIRPKLTGVDQELELGEQAPRLSFISEEAARRLDVATGASYRMVQFNLAQEMQQAGINERAIKLATGWHRGNTGAWEYELVDKDVRLLISLENNSLNTITLDKLIHHPELFGAYPALRSVPIVFTKLDGQYGQYDPQRDLINIDVNIPSDEILSTLMHEIQHAIQTKEGWSDPRGVGGPKDFIDPKAMDMLVNAKRTYQTYLLDNIVTNSTIENYLTNFGIIVDENGRFNSSFDFNGTLVNNLEEFRDEVFFTYSVPPSKFEDIPLINHANENTRNDARIFYEDIKKKYDSAWKNYRDAYQEGYNTYLGLIHELESRVVQVRQGMTEEERRLSPVSETENLVRNTALNPEVILNLRSLHSVNDPQRLKNIIYDLGQTQAADPQVETENQNNDGTQTRFSVVTDQSLIEQLEKNTVVMYRGIQVENTSDGGVIMRPIMGRGFVTPNDQTESEDSKVSKWKKFQGEVFEQGVWTEADVRGDIISEWAYSKEEDQMVPYILLDKGPGQTPIRARFNPYNHVSDTPLNDQFTSAWKRPEIRIARVEIPGYVFDSELKRDISHEKINSNEVYRAEVETPDGRIAYAKDPEGLTDWKAGLVEGQLLKIEKKHKLKKNEKGRHPLARNVYISQYAKITGILTSEEVASEIFENKIQKARDLGEELNLPVNLFPEDVRRILEDRYGIRFDPPRGITAPKEGWESVVPMDENGKVIPLRELDQLAPNDPPGLRTKFSITRRPSNRREVAGAPGVFRLNNGNLEVDESRLPKDYEAETVVYGAVRSSKSAMENNHRIDKLISEFRGSQIATDVMAQYFSLPQHQSEAQIETDERLMFALVARWVLNNPSQSVNMLLNDGRSLYVGVAQALMDTAAIAMGTEKILFTDSVLNSVANAIGGVQNNALHEGIPTPVDLSLFRQRFNEQNIFADVRNFLDINDSMVGELGPNGTMTILTQEDEGTQYRIVGADPNAEGTPEEQRSAFTSAIDRISQRGITNFNQLADFFTEDKTLPVFLQTGNNYGILGEAAQQEDVERFMEILPLHLRERIQVHYQATNLAETALQGALGIFYPFARGKKMIHVRAWDRTLGQVLGTISHEASHFGWSMWESPLFRNSIAKIYDLAPDRIYQELTPYFQVLGISQNMVDSVSTEVKVYMVNELYAKINQNLLSREGNKVADILGVTPSQYATIRDEVSNSINDIETGLIASLGENNVTEEIAKAFAQDILKLTIGASVGRGVNAFYQTNMNSQYNVDASGMLIPNDVINIFVNDYGQRRIEGKDNEISKQVQETKAVIDYWTSKGKYGRVFATWILNNLPMKNGLSFLHLNVPHAKLGEQIATARANVLMGQVWRKVNEDMATELRDRYDIYLDLESALIDAGVDPGIITYLDNSTFEQTIKDLGLDSKKRLLEKAKLADEAVQWARTQIINGAINIRRSIKLQADNLAARMRVAFAQNPEQGEAMVARMYSQMNAFAEKFNGDWQHRMYRAFESEGQGELRAMLGFLNINPNTGNLRLKEEQDLAQRELENLNEILRQGVITPAQFRQLAQNPQRIIHLAKRLDALERYVKTRIGKTKLASLGENYSAYISNVMRAEIEEVLSYSEKVTSGTLGDDHLNTIAAVMQRTLDERIENHRNYIEFLDPETNILKVLLHSIDQQNKILMKLDYNAELGEHVLDSGMGTFRGMGTGQRMSSKIGYLEDGSFLQFIEIDPVFQEALEKEYNIQKNLRESFLGDIITAWRANNTVYSLKLGMSNFVGNMGLIIAGGHFLRWENMALGGGVAWEHFKERMRFGKANYEDAKKEVIDLMRKHHVLGGTVSDTRMIAVNKGVQERMIDLVFDGFNVYAKAPLESKRSLREKTKHILEKFRQFYALGDEWIKPIIFMNNYNVFLAEQEAKYPEKTREQMIDAAARDAAAQTLRETTAWDLTARMARELSANAWRAVTPDFIMHNFQMLRILAANYFRFIDISREIYSGLNEYPDSQAMRDYKSELRSELVRRGIGGAMTAATYTAIATTGMGIIPLAINSVVKALYGTKDEDEDKEKEPGKRTEVGTGYGGFTPAEWDGAVRATNWFTGGNNLFAPIFREDKWTFYGWNYARSNAMLTHIIPRIPNENWKPQDIFSTFAANMMDIQGGTMSQELVANILGKDRFGRDIGVMNGINKIFERAAVPGVVRQILGVTTGYEMSDTLFHKGKMIKIPEFGGITVNKYDLRDMTNMLAYSIRDRQDSDKNYHRRNLLASINKPERMTDAQLYVAIQEFRANNKYEIGKANYLLIGLQQLGLSDSDIVHYLSTSRASGSTIISKEKARAYVRGENILDTTFYDYLRRKRKSLIKDAKELRMSRDELSVVLDNYQRAMRIFRQSMQTER